MQRLPAWLTYAGAVLMGELTYLTWASRRTITKANFAVVLDKPHDHPDVARVARRTFRNFAKYITEIMRFPRLDRLDFAKLVQLEGWEHLKEGLARNRGVIFVSIHFGNFDLEIGRAHV